MTSRTTRPRSTARLVPALVVGTTAAVTAIGAAAFASGALDTVLAPPSAPGGDQPQDGVAVAGTAAPPRAVDGLDAELLRRFDAARAAAAEDGVDLTITSGHRTPEQQQSLVDDALARYGSADEAHRWVAPVDGSAHVAGTAIDVGPTDGAYWLLEHGAEFGLCQVFANEVWHFEATVEPGGTCGPTVPDASGLWH
jgi:hypothetical protein